MGTWKDCAVLPPLKDGWKHTEQVLVLYEATETNTSHFGIAYYHTEPPFRDKGHWVDFANYGKQPTRWMTIPNINS